MSLFECQLPKSTFPIKCFDSALMPVLLSSTAIHCCPFTVYWALMNTEPHQHTFLLSFVFKHFFISVLIETKFSSLFQSFVFIGQYFYLVETDYSLYCFSLWFVCCCWSTGPTGNNLTIIIAIVAVVVVLSAVIGIVVYKKKTSEREKQKTIFS